MGNNILKFLTIAVAVTMTTTLVTVVMRRKKFGYIRPLKLTYSFIYD